MAHGDRRRIARRTAIIAAVVALSLGMEIAGYLAKSVSSGESVKFVVRLQRRF